MWTGSHNYTELSPSLKISQLLPLLAGPQSQSQFNSQHSLPHCIYLYQWQDLSPSFIQLHDILSYQGGQHWQVSKQNYPQDWVVDWSLTTLTCAANFPNWVHFKIWIMISSIHPLTEALGLWLEENGLPSTYTTTGNLKAVTSVG